MAHGHARLTQDIDLNVVVPEEDLDHFCRLLAKQGFVFRLPDGLPFARERHILLLVHKPTKVSVDLSFAILSFQLQALERASSILMLGVRVKVIRPQDLVITKLVAGRPTDINDVRQLLLLHGKTMRGAEMRKVLDDFAAALDMPEISETFDREWAWFMRIRRKARK